MKRAGFLIVVLLAFLQAGAQLGLNISNISGSSQLTCRTPTINLVAGSTYTGGIISYTWIRPSGPPITSASISISNPGTYTLAAASGSLAGTQTISISANMVAPVSFITPTVQNINCTSSLVASTTLISTSSVNISHKVLSPYGGTFTAITPTVNYTAYGAGTFTHVLTNDVNGCATIRTFSIISSQGYPTFSLMSPAGFTVGCLSKTITIVNFINASATNSLQLPSGGPVSYTLLPPAASSIIPSGTLSPLSSYSCVAPGTWTAIVRDNTTFCTTKIPFSIASNTQPPVLDTLDVSTNILSCNTPSVVLKANSSTPNVSYNWSYGSGSQPGSTIAVSSNSATPNATLLGQYTLTVVDASTLGNLCPASTVVTMYQNVFRPNAAILAGTTILTCPANSVVLTNVSSTGIPANSIFSSSQPVVAALWAGPAPAIPASLTVAYAAFTGGVYTLTAKDLNNGCTAVDTITIIDQRDLPNASAQGPYVVQCPNGTVNISPLINGSMANLSFLWQLPVGSVASGIFSPTLAVSTPGNYTVSITNTLSTCTRTLQISVWACVGLGDAGYNQSIKLFPNPGKGFYTIEYNGAPGAELQISSNTGTVIKRQMLKQGENNVDIGNAAAGIYIVSLKPGTGGVYYSKLIKQ